MMENPVARAVRTFFLGHLIMEFCNDTTLSANMVQKLDLIILIGASPVPQSIESSRSLSDLLRFCH